MISATWQDIAGDLGRPTSEVSPEEQEQWRGWIDRVEGRILRRIPDLATRALEPAYMATLSGVVVDVVVRRVNNPEGYRSERVDDYGYDLRDNGPTNLWLSDEEWRELGWWASSEAFSTRPGFEPDVPAIGPQWV